MQHKIVTLPATVLRKKALPVTQDEFGTKALKDIIHQMSLLLRETDDGIGIAAPQIGVSKRLFLASEEALAIDRGEVDEATDAQKTEKKKMWKYYVFINPEIIKISSKRLKSTEGCLSVPKKYGLVPRAEKIRVRAYDENGKIFERGASQLFARLIQHEIDHLEGRLFIDSAEKIVSVVK